MRTFKKILKKKKNVDKLDLPGFKIYYKPIKNEMLLYSCQKRNIDQKKQNKKIRNSPKDNYVRIYQMTKIAFMFKEKF